MLPRSQSRGNAHLFLPRPTTGGPRGRARGLPHLLPECRSSIRATSPLASRKSPVYKTVPFSPWKRNLVGNRFIHYSHSHMLLNNPSPAGSLFQMFPYLSGETERPRMGEKAGRAGQVLTSCCLPHCISLWEAGRHC